MGGCGVVGWVGGEVGVGGEMVKQLVKKVLEF